MQQSAICAEHVRAAAEGLFFFTALHGMQTRSSDENSVCSSVRLSHACIVTKLWEYLSRFLYHTKEHLA